MEQRVTDLCGGSAPSCDGLTVVILKNSIKHFFPPLQHTIICSFSSGIFPDALKIAKVIPIIESGSKSNINIYRPISLLSVVCKVLEKIVKQHLQHILEIYNISSLKQFGFRANKNTSGALFSINKLIYGFNEP